ncbi:MAG: 3-hydroxylacyl-ACP dehydratase [Methylococcales bacterium]|jgi:predicted hotdog family 3-hydroxylacyl-ACP dehydratase|nr:3-hydroxylacyl-ACP dehydratase [Methylococcales bacterium]MBT7410726.1 3-hydroxylacyl-ACP dehydratase [Methylococcales bacterium]
MSKQNHLNNIDIGQLIPHSKEMVLLDQVIDYDEHQIIVTTQSHLNKNNPLRFNDQLSATCGVEYAAQSMALHSSLINQHSSNEIPKGYLAAVRKLQLTVQRLDQIEGKLEIKSEKIAIDTKMLIYTFQLSAKQALLVEGQISIYLY